jgi:hypothetical protein
MKRKFIRKKSIFGIKINFKDSLIWFASIYFDWSVPACCVHLEYALSFFFLAYFKRGASGCRDYDHRLVWVIFVHGFADVDAVLIGDVVVLS